MRKVFCDSCQVDMSECPNTFVESPIDGKRWQLCFLDVNGKRGDFCIDCIRAAINGPVRQDDKGFAQADHVVEGEK